MENDNAYGISNSYAIWWLVGLLLVIEKNCFAVVAYWMREDKNIQLQQQKKVSSSILLLCLILLVLGFCSRILYRSKYVLIVLQY